MSSLEPTHSFDKPLQRIREGLDGTSNALICLDFDGTLAPIVDDPDDARITPENRAAIDALSTAPNVTTAIVTGRELSDVRARVSFPIVYAGNHGLELYRNGSVATHPIARKRSNAVEEVCVRLERGLEAFPDCHVENKGLTGTVHVRSARASTRERVHRITRETVERLGGRELEVSPGKRVVEISPAVPWGKGDVVRLLEKSCPEETFVLYIGDDVSDESAFRAIEPDGVGVHVGTDRASVASCRVRSPSEVASLLAWLVHSGIDDPFEEPPDTLPSVSAAGSD